MGRGPAPVQVVDAGLLSKDFIGEIVEVNVPTTSLALMK